MQTLKADILSGIDPNRLTIILHGCNCFHIMGAGIAGYLAKKFPEVLKADRTTIRGSIEKLGSLSIATLNQNLYVVNCYTQYSPGADAKLEYVDQCLNNFVKFGRLGEADIRLPKIGCGIGGLKWVKVEPIFDKYLSTFPAKVYYI